MTHNGVSVLDIAPDFSSLRSGLLDDASFKSIDNGAATPWKVTSKPRRTVTYPFSLTSRDDIATFRRFFSARHGRLHRFWIPLYLLDYKINSISGTEVIIQHVGLTDAVTDFDQFRYIIFYTNGLLQIGEVQSIVSDGTIETVTLATALETEIEPDETLCGALMMARCVSDDLDLRFESLEFANATVRCVELPAEYADGSGGEGGGGDDPILDDGDPGTTPPGEGGTVTQLVSNYVWFIPAESDPNTAIDADLIGIYKQLFTNEKAIALEGVVTTGIGEWYWYFASTSGTFKSALHKTGHPSTDPESPDGERETTTAIGWWALAQDYRTA